MVIVEIKENKDGSANMIYELDMKEISYFKDLAKEKKVKFNKDFINKTILMVLHQQIENDLEKDVYKPTKGKKKGKK